MYYLLQRTFWESSSRQHFNLFTWDWSVLQVVKHLKIVYFGDNLVCTTSDLKLLIILWTFWFIALLLFCTLSKYDYFTKVLWPKWPFCANMPLINYSLIHSFESNGGKNMVWSRSWEEQDNAWETSQVIVRTTPLITRIAMKLVLIWWMISDNVPWMRPTREKIGRDCGLLRTDNLLLKKYHHSSKPCTLRLANTVIWYWPNTVGGTGPIP